MLKLSVSDIVKGNENCYSLVIAVAKRARAIAEKAEEEGEILDEKPVQMAVQEFIEGKYHIVDHPVEEQEPEETDAEENTAEPENGEAQE